MTKGLVNTWPMTCATRPLTGSLLSGQFGKGRHTHTSLTLHLQAQNMVPGGLKLLVNLLDAGLATRAGIG